MSELVWVATSVGEGVVFASEVVEEYEIVQKPEGEFFVRRLIADCDDIGPLDTFQAAENIVLKIGMMMVQFEEQMWRVIAAQNLPEDAAKIEDAEVL